LVSIKYIRRRPGRFQAFEIRVRTNLRHGSEDLGKAPPAGTGQCGSEDFPMFGLGAAAVCPGPLLERPHKFFIDAAYQQVSHLVTSKNDDINDITLLTACQGRLEMRRRCPVQRVVADAFI
jgi:hypothetical protein